MIPIIYESTETTFASNGLGRLRDAIEVKVVEERNGVYEADFQYPVTGANYDLIQVGRIIGITHDESGDIEPFDIVSYTKPIDGVVTFHCTHISYRLSYCTVKASSINSLSAAFTAFNSAEPNMPFSFQTDKDSTGFVAGFDGLPHTVRSLMGGTEGSILDAYGGEYSYNNWTVYLHAARGQARDFAIRYGVNMLDYNEEYDTQGTYSSCIPYWTDGTTTIVGDKQDAGSLTPSGRDQCVPLDLSDKFESQPTKAQVEAMAATYLSSNNTTVPKQTIKVDFVRLQDMGYENLGSLMQCNLCDTIKVIFPDYNSTGTYKIVKTTWNVLENRYEEMELGELSTTLAEALGIDSSSGSKSAAAIVLEAGTNGIWTYRKWSDGTAECWGTYITPSLALSRAYGSLYIHPSDSITGGTAYPFTFTSAPKEFHTMKNANTWVMEGAGATTTNTAQFWIIAPVARTAQIYSVNIHAIGTWK